MRSLAKQLQECVAANKRAPQPARLTFTSFQGGLLMRTGSQVVQDCRIRLQELAHTSRTQPAPFVLEHAGGLHPWAQMPSAQHPALHLMPSHSDALAPGEVLPFVMVIILSGCLALCR